jgi:hypothetical protein
MSRKRKLDDISDLLASLPDDILTEVAQHRWYGSKPAPGFSVAPHESITNRWRDDKRTSVAYDPENPVLKWNVKQERYIPDLMNGPRHANEMHVNWPEYAQAQAWPTRSPFYNQFYDHPSKNSTPISQTGRGPGGKRVYKTGGGLKQKRTKKSVKK